MNIESMLEYLRNYRAKIKIMEVCGTHTAAIAKNGIRGLLPENIKLVSGPGCPVCVTPASFIDTLINYAQTAEVLTFGDMFRVPGSRLSLAGAKAQGAQVRLMYSPFEIITLAQEQPSKQFIIAAVGFETTAPVYAALLETLEAEGIANVRLCAALKTMPEALAFICDNEGLDAFICPGHVSAVIGANAYIPIYEQYKKPCVIAGFEAEHIIAALYEIARQLETGRCCLTNLYPSVVKPPGQARALELLDKYFIKTTAYWRGIGDIANSGYTLRDKYARYAVNDMPIHNMPVHEAATAGCRCADVLLGRMNPNECGLFGKSCTPSHPVGACMVSAEGACGVWANGSLS